MSEPKKGPQPTSKTGESHSQRITRNRRPSRLGGLHEPPSDRQQQNRERQHRLDAFGLSALHTVQQLSIDAITEPVAIQRLKDAVAKHWGDGGMPRCEPPKKQFMSHGPPGIRTIQQCIREQVLEVAGNQDPDVARALLEEVSWLFEDGKQGGAPHG